MNANMKRKYCTIAMQRYEVAIALDYRTSLLRYAS